MKQYLPSKQFFIVILSLALLFGGVFGYKTWRSKVVAERNRLALEKITAEAKKHENIDTDRDGLMDWEEAFWGTNAQKTDTDGDGTSDEKEIELRRDPLTPGPNDYVRAIGNADQLMTVSKEELTESEKLSREMLTAIMYSKDPNDPNFQKTVTQGIIDNLNEKGTNLPHTYALSQIKTITETEESLKAYGNAVGSILKNSTETEKENKTALMIIAKGLKTGNNSVFEEFNPLMENNRNEVSNLLKISVPKYTASLHLALINSIENIAFSMGNVKYVISDPLRGLIGMQQYKTALQNTGDARQKISDHLSNSGIVFTDTEKGINI